MEHQDEPTADDGPKPSTGGFELPEEFHDATTAELVERAQHGDVDALNDLFGRYHQTVVEVARRRLGPKLRRKEEPDDLAQTTFREATRDFKNYQFRGDDSLLRWLIQILQNKIRDRAEFYGAGKRDSSMELALDAPIDPERDFGPRSDPPSHELSVTRMVQRDERHQLLRAALTHLSPEHRQAITLVFFEGLQLRDAGQRMGGKSEDAVRMMLKRAEGKLGEILGRTIGRDLDL